MNPALETLPDTPAELKQMIIGLRDQHERQIDVYVEQIRHLRQLLFGRRSEKMPGDTDKVQLPLFDMPEPEQIEPIKVTVDAHARKNRAASPCRRSCHGWKSSSICPRTRRSVGAVVPCPVSAKR